MVNYVYISAFAGNIVAFVAGTALTWSSPVEPQLKDNSKNPFSSLASDEERSWIISLMPLGAALGPFIYGYSADKFGRKLTLTSLGIPFLISYFILAFAEVIPLYYLARILIGMAVGGVFTVMPMYVGEIAEDTNRGALGSAMNCFITAGLTFSYCVGPFVSLTAFNIILGIFPVIFMALFFIFAPESPHFYIAKGRSADAEASLNKLRGQKSSNSKELEEIKDSIEKAGSGSMADLFKSKGLIKALIISLALVGFQQFSGINAVLFYTQTIFEASGSDLKPEICSIIIGSVQFGTSFVTPLAADRLGRKILLLFSAIGMLVCEIPLGLYFYLKDDKQDVEAISWLPIISLVLYIVTYNVGFGPLPWAVMGELFPANVKSIASSLTAGFCWIIGFLITKFFATIADEIGMGPSFWMFSAFCVLAALFVMFYLIETKGKSLQEIQDLLEG